MYNTTIWITIFIIVALIGAGGCTFLRKSQQLVKDTSQLRTQYELVAEQVQVTQDIKGVWNQDEWAELKTFDVTVQSILKKLDYIKEYEFGKASLDDVYVLYNFAEMGYKQVYAVVEPKYNQLPENLQVTIKAFSVKAEETDKQIDELLKDPSDKNIASAISLILKLAGVTLRTLSAVSAI